MPRICCTGEMIPACRSNNKRENSMRQLNYSINKSVDIKIITLMSSVIQE